MAGSFWTSFGVRFGSTSSGINDLLEKEDVTLEELLDHEDVIQECKYMNNALIDHLALPENTKKLIEYVVTIPDLEADEGPPEPSKRPYVSSELFLCETTQALFESMFSDEAMMDVLFGFLDQKAPIDPSCASYFRKVAIQCVRRNYEGFMQYASDKGILAKFIEHIGLHSVMELLIYVGWSEPIVDTQTTCTWLFNEGLIPKLVARLDPAFENEPDVHSNTSLVLMDLLLKMEGDSKNVLVSHLKSPLMLDQLFNFMLSGSSSCLRHILNIMVVLVRQHAIYLSQLPDDEAGIQWAPNPVIEGLKERLPKLMELLQNPPDVWADLALQNGPLARGNFGEIRMSLLELCCMLLKCNIEEVSEALIKLNFFSIMLDLFFGWENNNIMHGRVLDIVAHVIESKLSVLQDALLGEAKLAEQLQATADRNNKWIAEHRSQRLGYMGHVIRISNMLCQACTEQAPLNDLVDSKEWQAYVEGPLAHENEQAAFVLGGARPQGAMGFDGMSGDGYFANEEEDEEEEELANNTYGAGASNFPTFGDQQDWGSNMHSWNENSSSSDEDDYTNNMTNTMPPASYSSSSDSSDDDDVFNNPRLGGSPTGIVPAVDSDSDSDTDSDEAGPPPPPRDAFGDDDDDFDDPFGDSGSGGGVDPFAAAPGVDPFAAAPGSDPFSQVVNADLPTVSAVQPSADDSGTWQPSADDFGDFNPTFSDSDSD